MRSTGKLSAEKKAQQEACYAEHHGYDYVIIGTGISALAVGALLANAGERVCLLEARAMPGGHAHTFEKENFNFCGQLHSIWGCAPGQRIYEFLKYLKLEEEITFGSYNPDGYDHVSLPDGKRIHIPYGFENLEENLNLAYPGQEQQLRKFFKIINKINRELALVPKGEPWWSYLFQSLKFINVIKYRNRTVQSLFDECGLSKEVQAVLSVTSNDFMLPPAELSLIAYILHFGGCNEGAYYPTKHYKHFIESLADFITCHTGCHIYYDTEVTKIELDKGKVNQVMTSGGKTFKAYHFICSIDPQKASHLIGQHHFPRAHLSSLSCDTSSASFIMYLGLNNIPLEEYDFGNHILWHLPQWDMNKIWEDLRNNCFDAPWVAFSTPTLQTDSSQSAPEGCHILEITTGINYDWLKQLHDTNAKAYRGEIKLVSEKLLDVAESYIPSLREHIVQKVIGTPTQSADFNFKPNRNAFKADFSAIARGLGPSKPSTAWKNFFWCNDRNGCGGVYGAIQTGMDLYGYLTNDHFFDRLSTPSSQAAIAYATQQALKTDVECMQSTL